LLYTPSRRVSGYSISKQILGEPSQPSTAASPSRPARRKTNKSGVCVCVCVCVCVDGWICFLRHSIPFHSGWIDLCFYLFSTRASGPNLWLLLFSRRRIDIGVAVDPPRPPPPPHL
jgi:hypothetical protein